MWCFYFSDKRSYPMFGVFHYEWKKNAEKALHEQLYMDSHRIDKSITMETSKDDMIYLIHKDMNENNPKLSWDVTYSAYIYEVTAMDYERIHYE